MINKDPEKHPQEASFTLLEVIIAVGLLTAVVIQMATGQGTIFGMVDYGQRSTEAIWLAKRIMAQVEYNYHNLELKDLDISVKDQVFREVGDPDFEYLWSLEIQEWKLPIFDLLAGGGPKSEEEEAEAETPAPNAGSQALAGFEDAINQVFDGHILKTARVEVSWPDGARRNSVSLSYLLTNQKKLDEYLTLKKSTWENVIKQSTPGVPPPPPPGSNPGGGPGGTPGSPNSPGTPGSPAPPTPSPTPIPPVEGDEGGGGEI